ncbi:hypothetical protein PBAC_32670 [Pedobacter glucosidilyticus]|nr:hypothetical protein [Pedobacter glucosidilyticus]KHJ36544.1 hypothetical protein PBAC_32670 [Pedobacter glucosidilyticus]
MILISFIIGSVTGVAVASFFIGKEFYKFYKKSNIQEKKIQRLLKINAKIRESASETSRRISIN